MSITRETLPFEDKETKELIAKGGLAAAKYDPSDEERDVRSAIIREFTSDSLVMNAPRREFNDLSVAQRDATDFMAFNTYQPNDGSPYPGDAMNSWRSGAIRPVERNKAISMAAHVGGRLGFLKVSAEDGDGSPQDGAAEVVNSQVDWVRSKWFPEEWWLHAVLQSEVSPAAHVLVEYREVMKKIKTKKVNGAWQYREEPDEALSGYHGTIIPTDQIYIPNFFEKDIQKQPHVIRRRLINWSLAKDIHGEKKNFEFVRKGKQVLWLPSGGFSYWADPELSAELVEEVTYWTKAGGGARIYMLSGVIVGDHDAPNPREDGLYPIAKWFFSWIRENCYYGKSAVFAVSHDANIINTLYPVLVDGAILDVMKPMGYVGSDVIGSDVIVPGMTTVMKDPGAKLAPLLPPMSTNGVMTAIREVEASLTETQNSDAVPADRRNMTAYEIDAREQQLARDLTPFMSELVGASAQLTRLLVGDLLQYSTLGEISDVQGADRALKYKSFLVDRPGGKGRRKIRFETLPDSLTGEQALEESFKTLEEQERLGRDVELLRADPRRIRKFRYSYVVGEDVLRPKSDAVKYRQNVETLDRAIAAKAAGANVDMDALAEKLLFADNPVTARDTSEFMLDAPQAPPGGPQALPGQPGLVSGLPQPFAAAMGR